MRGWGASQLLAAWCLYWLALVLVAAGPTALRIAWHLARDPARHGQVSFSFDGGTYRATIAERGGPSWAGAVHAPTLAFWLVVPPLLLFAVWLATRPRRADAAPDTPDAGPRGLTAGRRDAAGEFRAADEGAPAVRGGHER